MKLDSERQRQLLWAAVTQTQWSGEGAEEIVALKNALRAAEIEEPEDGPDIEGAEEPGAAEAV